MDANYKPLTIATVILPRGKGEIAAGKIKDVPSFSFVCLGRGTANTDILDYLGLGETEKDVLFIAADSENSLKIKEILKKEIDFDTAGSGVYFSIPISSVAGPVNYAILSGQTSKENEHEQI